MRSLKIGIIDILSKSAARSVYSRNARPNNVSIMPQVLAVWAEELGHQPSIVYYDGPVALFGTMPDDVDLVFINAFSQGAMLAYALSAYYRDKGAVTALGGPHARSYPDHAAQYFDYVIGFCDKSLMQDIVQDCAEHRPMGQVLSAKQQPAQLPGLEQRWPHLRPVLEQARLYRIVPLIGSLGCPYTCSFCIDALVPYQPLDFTSLGNDLRFLLKNKLPRTVVAWHDPNFGVRFDDYLGAIEEAIPPGSLTFVAETSLSLLKEENCKRLQKNGFRVILPGIESWYDVGGKSAMRSTKGYEKVERIAEQANMVMRYIPYFQGNLILGLDVDAGDEPFELTKQFIDLAPGVFPFFSLLMSYGRNAPDNLRYQREGRVLNVPFHFLNQLHSMNVRPKNYTWERFFEHVCAVYDYAFSPRTMLRRFRAVKHAPSRMEQVLRGWGSERGHKYLGNHKKMLHRIRTDAHLREYLNGERTDLPDVFLRPIQEDLQWLWEWLPKDAIHHDPNAYLKALNNKEVEAPVVRPGMAVA